MVVEYNDWNETETDTEMCHQPNDNWNEIESNTEKGHQPNDNWNDNWN